MLPNTGIVVEETKLFFASVSRLTGRMCRTEKACPMENHVASNICIRPSYIWPASATSKHQQPALCKEEGMCIRSVTRRRELAGLFVGHGPAGSDVAVASSQILAGALAPQLLHDEQYNLAPVALNAAFEQCHQQLLQLQPRQDPAANSSPGSTVDTETSGASALVLSLDQEQGKLLVASAGLCKAVLARSSTGGHLTVMELTPRLALGHDPTETARIDATGSSIYYQQLPAAAALPAGRAAAVDKPAATAAPSATQTDTSITGNPSSDALNNTAVLDRSRAIKSSSYLTQFDAVLIAPDGTILQDVGTSRMLGFSSATAAGVLETPVVTSWRLTGSESFIVLGSPGLWQAMNPAEVVDYVAAALASGIPGSSNSSSSASGGGAAVSIGDLLTLEAQERLKLKLMDQLVSCCPAPAVAPVAAGVVPDVTAAVLLLDDSPALCSTEVDMIRMKSELATVSRACRSNAEAHALQALWSASCFCCDQALAGPPAPAMSSLLPVLSVAGHCWPSTFWPTYEAVVTPPSAAPAALQRRDSGKPSSYAADIAAATAKGDQGAALAAASNDEDWSGSMTLLEAARSTGLLHRNTKNIHVSRGGNGSNAHNRASTFVLNSRLSCELDLSHDHGSYGSCGCLADCPHTCSEDSPDQQSMIVHKVRLSGPCELESLLFGNATTSHPDTTVARILKPCNSAASWSSADALSPSAAASRSIAAGNVHLHMEAHQRQLPRRSASVTIAALTNRNIRRMSSSNSSSGGGVGAWTLREAAAAADSRRSSLGLDGKDGSLVAAGSLLYNSTASGHMISQDQQLQFHDTGLVKKARSYQALSALQAAGLGHAASLPAPALPSMAEDSSGNSGLKQSQQRMANALQEGRAAGSSVAFRSAFRLPDHTAAGGVMGGRNVQRPAELQHAWTAAASVIGAASGGTVSQLLRPQQQQQQQAVPMSLSCPTDSLSSEHDGEGKVRGGIRRDRRSSCRLAQEEAVAAVAAAAAAEALQAALGQLEDKQGVFEGKVRGGRRSSNGISADAIIAAAGAAEATQKQDEQGSSSTWQLHAVDAGLDSSSKSKADHKQWLSQPLFRMQFQQGLQYDKQNLESCVRGGKEKSVRMRKVMTSPDLISFAAQQAAADSAYDEAAVTAVQASLKASRSVRTSWDGTAVSAVNSITSAPALSAFGARTIAVPSSKQGLKLLKLSRKKKQGSSAAASKDSSELGVRLSGSSIRSGSSSVTSRGSSIDMSHTAPQTVQKVGTSLAAAAAATAVAAVVSALAGRKAHAGSAASMQDSIGSVPAMSSRTGSSTAQPVSAFSGSASISFSAGVAAADAAGALHMDREPSTCLSDGSMADGAVHGGELGDEALEGQMRGGRRSSSMSLSGSMLLPRLDFTSSGGEDTECGNSLSPSGHPHSLFICSSMSESSSSMQRQQNSLAAASTAAAAESNSSSPSAMHSPFASTASSSKVAGPAAAAAAAAALVQPSSIQVIRMASGTFTRVRLAASAPAAGAGCSSSSLGGSSSQRLLGEQQQHTMSCSQLEHVTDGLFDSSMQMRRVSSSAGGQVLQQAASFGAESAPSSSTSSNFRPASAWTSSRAWGANSRTSTAIKFGKFPLPPGNASGAAAVGNSSDSTGGGVQGSLETINGGGGGGSMIFRSAFSNSGSGAGGSSTVSSPHSSRDSSTVRVSFADALDDYHQRSNLQDSTDAAPTAAGLAVVDAANTSSQVQGVLAAQLSGLPKRQRSLSNPLPTLQESPAATPGSSPQPLITGSSCNSSYAACKELPGGAGLTQQQMQEQVRSLQEQLGLVAQQQEQQQQSTLPQSVPTLGSVDPVYEHSGAASPVIVSASALVCSFEDHSLADFDDTDTLNDDDDGDVAKQQSESPPCGRRSGKSFEFSRPYAVSDECYESPAHLGNRPLSLG